MAVIIKIRIFLVSMRGEIGELVLLKIITRFMLSERSKIIYLRNASD